MSLADKFNLLNEFNILRIICGAFFIPHIVGKITVPATLEFFVKAGFKPPKTWMTIAGAIETVLTIGLIFGIYTQYVALIAFIHLLVAAAATYKVTKKLDLGHRRRRILRVLGDLLSGGRHALLALTSNFLRKGNPKMASVLFSPLTMRGLTLPDRVVVSPMCQYNSNNGSANDWHLMHLGSFSLGAAGLVMCEMTNVNPQGRISPKCAGM